MFKNFFRDIHLIAFINQIIKVISFPAFPLIEVRIYGGFMGFISKH